ncbi:hypothetical protein SDC9_103961 [bioreactor metagenome]|uniref:Uncharacterized protein n=1 Tax=bioreactor metagenome TaxID=1076179 RepID=A0A645AVG4_9ZZZZ|nr:hypothetical protein [Christensenella sp.]
MKRPRAQLAGAAALFASLLFLAACASPASPEPTATSEATAAPAATASPTPVITPTPAPTPTATPTGIPATTAPQQPTPTPTPKGPRMYSSYADLTSFDPETGIAKFDYFDMLRGKEAVDFLVAHEGYKLADAQKLVDNFADSEFVKKNTNNQLRAIDLDDVSLKLMVQPNGDPVDGAESVVSTASDFRKIYGIDTSLLLESYFYHITVSSSGRVTLVEQVYWP